MSETPEALHKFEEYVRKSTFLWEHLDDLEGKVLGCWCHPGPCHGDVLARLLEEKKLGQIKKDLHSAGLKVLVESDLGEIRKARKWAESPLWLSHATRLDDTNIFYFTPAVFELLKQGAVGPDKWDVHTNDGMVYYVVGMFEGVQPLGPFYPIPPMERQIDFELEEGEMTDEEDSNTNALADVMKRFSEAVTPHIKNNPKAYHHAMTEATQYFRFHRVIVQEVGEVLGVDMRDHDLTKTRLVQVALAFCWHWPQWAQAAKDKNLKQLAQVLIKKGHLEQEDHHPEYAAAKVSERGVGHVDAHKLFTDRVSVHLQKDPRDKSGGWDLNARFIPKELTPAWESFRENWRTVDLYAEALVKAEDRMNWK